VPNTTNIFEQKPDFDTLGGRLSRAREASGMSLKDLAWRLGVKKATVQIWESDRAEPGSHRLTMLAGLLQVSLSWLLHGVGTGPSELHDDEAVEAADSQLQRLRKLHAETGDLIARLQNDLNRLNAVAR
jgi:HTH-type transcriptional regulator, cell division transcriptional repressor